MTDKLFLCVILPALTLLFIAAGIWLLDSLERLQTFESILAWVVLATSGYAFVRTSLRYLDLGFDNEEESNDGFYRQIRW